MLTIIIVDAILGFFIYLFQLIKPISESLTNDYRAYKKRWAYWILFSLFIMPIAMMLCYLSEDVAGDSLPVHLIIVALNVFYWLFCLKFYFKMETRFSSAFR